MRKIIAAFCALWALFPGLPKNAGCAGEDGSVPTAYKNAEELCGLAACVTGRFFDSFGKKLSVNSPVTRKAGFEKTETQAPAVYETVSETECWVANEISFVSEKTYSDPFSDVTLDLVLSGCGRRYVIPGFWDGGSVWRVRFACPSAGDWYYETVCSDSGNSALNGRTGKVVCSEYSGGLDVYKHGFVTTLEGKKYFTYDDGEPFLYLGDTHWSLGDETPDMVDEISAQRASQGFTVIQSEPIGAGFDLTDGVTEADMAGFADYDKKFSVIASYGLTHANSEFFYPSYMKVLTDRYGGYIKDENGKDTLAPEAKEYLEKLTRYWVARYSAYPVMWTLGQEVDNDFYGMFSADCNPYTLVAEYIDKYDAYSHPLSAHQENVGSTVALGGAANSGRRFSKSSQSVFYGNSVHDWYAAQWTPSKTSQSDFSVEKEYYYNSEGKPSVNYEGQYCYLWTKNFGSRMQGWCAFLNGMCGYGWGGHDTWSYLNVYDEGSDSSDGVDTITSEEKINATWRDSLEYPSSYQCGYMAGFLNNLKWYELVPRFDDRAYFAPCDGVYYCMASNRDNTEAVIYFYSFTDPSVAAKANTDGYGGVLTGTLGNLEPGGQYKYRWFNPVTGEYSEEGTFTAGSYGVYFIGEKLWCDAVTGTDMVFYMYK